MNVTLFKDKKRYNSVFTPSPAGGKKLTNVTLKENTNMRNPVILVENFTDIREYRLAYLNNSFYFIEDFESYRGMWYIHLRKDVLGTYKNSILSSSQYVARCSDRRDEYIIDPYNVATTEVTHVKKQFNTHAKLAYNNGSVIIGVASSTLDATREFPRIGGLTYYVLTVSQYTDLVNRLMSAIGAITTSIINVSDHIKSVRWFPFTPSLWDDYSDNVSSINLGWIDFKLSGNVRLITSLYMPLMQSDVIKIPKHPQTDVVGQFLNSTSFCSYNLVSYPAGIISLDPNEMQGMTGIIASYKVDVFTGTAIFTVKGDNGKILYTMKTSYGALLPVTNETVGLNIGAIASTAGAVITKDLTGALAGASSALGSLAPKNSMTGGVSTIIDYFCNEQLQADFLRVTKADADDLGYPLYTRVSKLSEVGSGSGTKFCKVVDADVSFASYLDNLELKTLMEGGFFL